VNGERSRAGRGSASSGGDRGDDLEQSHGAAASGAAGDVDGEDAGEQSGPRMARGGTRLGVRVRQLGQRELSGTR
jgi:hypothetical protein